MDAAISCVLVASIFTKGSAPSVVEAKGLFRELGSIPSVVVPVATPQPSILPQPIGKSPFETGVSISVVWAMVVTSVTATASPVAMLAAVVVLSVCATTSCNSSSGELPGCVISSPCNGILSGEVVAWAYASVGNPHCQASMHTSARRLMVFLARTNMLLRDEINIEHSNQIAGASGYIRNATKIPTGTVYSAIPEMRFC